MSREHRKFSVPFKAYTAASNIEAHMLVELLESHGIPAFADEDQSGVSLWSFGRISQFHQPNVWIDKSTAEAAAQHILRFEETQRNRARLGATDNQIEVECDECGKTSMFPDNMDGTTQECPHCGGYVDVGEIGWTDDLSGDDNEFDEDDTGDDDDDY